MGKKFIDKVIEKVIRCPACRGSGEVPHYTQGANEVIKNGRTVAYTNCTRMRRCPTCGGDGSTR